MTLWLELGTWRAFCLKSADGDPPPHVKAKGGFDYVCVVHSGEGRGHLLRISLCLILEPRAFLQSFRDSFS